MAVLSDQEVEEALAVLPGWERAGDTLVRDLRFADFRQAVAFVLQVAFEAESADHHPDLDIRYNRVHVALSTHSEGGVTAKDLDLAHVISALTPEG
ncbi:MAG TPA: 4a-hydroxytetrahydrobiopterin dehydratase [Acidimicrobiales bacterium]|nr:4a-hydroxytetrahydrobiopterin dehydratase [Acidimicrobiales bacterium]